MANFTYLLGAGASFNALPINKKSTKDPSKPSLCDELKLYRDKYFHQSQPNPPKIFNSLDEVIKTCFDFGTPDLAAKFYLETGDDGKYRLLTKLLSNYFTYKQEILKLGEPVFGKDMSEPRALTFLTTISTNRTIPENIKILSWNYDSQIEIAAQKLRKLHSAAVEKISGFTCWPNCKEGEKIEPVAGIPFLNHLNGIAGHNYSPRDFDIKIHDWYDFDDPSETLLSFAWENESNAMKDTFIAGRLKYAEWAARTTDYLVIIGYSFPFFNRVIDKFIFDSMRPNLKKIYIQDPYSKGDQLRNQFDLPANLAIEHIENTDNYYIPYEL